MSLPADAWLPETHPLALFLGEAPRLVLGGSLDATAPAVVPDLLTGKVGSILVVPGARGLCRGSRLEELLAGCRRAMVPGGRLAILGRNPLRASMGSMRAMLTARAGAARLFQSASSPPARSVLAGLHATGWKDVARFVVAPSVEDPASIRPHQGRASWRAPAFLIIASDGLPGSQSSSGLQLMLDAIRDARPDLSAEEKASLVSVTNSSRGKTVAIAQHGQERFVLRIARSEAMLRDEARSFAVLRRMEANGTVSARVPRPVLEGVAGGLHFFVQGHLPGSALADSLRPDNRAKYLAQVEAFLRGLNRDVSEAVPVAVDSLKGAWVGQPMVPYVLKHIDDAALRARTRDLIDEALRGALGRRGIVHGDFGASNILVQDARLTGVIDWEASHEHGLPVLDSFNYLDATHRHCNPGLEIADTLSMLATGEWPVQGEVEFLKRSFDQCAMDFRLRRGVAILYLFFHIGPQLRFAGSESGPKRRLVRALGQLLA